MRHIFINLTCSIGPHRYFHCTTCRGGMFLALWFPGTVFGRRWGWHDAGSIIDIWRIRVSFFLGFWGLFFAFMSWCGFWYIFIRFWFPPPLSRGPYYMHQLLPFHSHCIRDVHPLYCCSGRAWTFIICCSWFMPIWQASRLITSLFSDILSSVTRHDFTWSDWRMAQWRLYTGRHLYNQIVGIVLQFIVVWCPTRHRACPWGTDSLGTDAICWRVAISTPEVWIPTQYLLFPASFLPCSLSSYFLHVHWVFT